MGTVCCKAREVGQSAEEERFQDILSASRIALPNSMLVECFKSHSEIVASVRSRLARPPGELRNISANGNLSLALYSSVSTERANACHELYVDATLPLTLEAFFLFQANANSESALRVDRQLTDCAVLDAWAVDEALFSVVRARTRPLLLASACDMLYVATVSRTANGLVLALVDLAQTELAALPKYKNVLAELECPRAAPCGGAMQIDGVLRNFSSVNVASGFSRPVDSPYVSAAVIDYWRALLGEIARFVLLADPSALRWFAGDVGGAARIIAENRRLLAAKAELAELIGAEDSLARARLEQIRGDGLAFNASTFSFGAETLRGTKGKLKVSSLIQKAELSPNGAKIALENAKLPTNASTAAQSAEQSAAETAAKDIRVEVPSPTESDALGVKANESESGLSSAHSEELAEAIIHVCKTETLTIETKTKEKTDFCSLGKPSDAFERFNTPKLNAVQTPENGETIVSHFGIFNCSNVEKAVIEKCEKEEIENVISEENAIENTEIAENVKKIENTEIAQKSIKIENTEITEKDKKIDNNKITQKTLSNNVKIIKTNEIAKNKTIEKSPKIPKIEKESQLSNLKKIDRSPTAKNAKKPNDKSITPKKVLSEIPISNGVSPTKAKVEKSPLNPKQTPSNSSKPSKEFIPFGWHALNQTTDKSVNETPAISVAKSSPKKTQKVISPIRPSPAKPTKERAKAKSPSPSASKTSIAALVGRSAATPPRAALAKSAPRSGGPLCESCSAGELDVKSPTPNGKKGEKRGAAKRK